MKFTAIAIICFIAHAAFAQGADEVRCRKEVKDYLETLRFLRQSAGSEIGDKVAKGYVPEEEVQRVMTQQGACAAAQLLREKKAPR